MAVYAVTTSNWNSAAFWAGINESGSGQTLDFSGLPSNFSVTFDPDTNTLTITDGVTSYVIGDAAYGGAADATLGGATLWSYFSTVSLAGGDDYVDGGADEDVIELTGPFGNDTVIGGETVTTGSDFDRLDLSGAGVGVEMTFLGDESGVATDGTGITRFSEFEAFTLTDQNDTVDGYGTNASMTVDALGGADSVVGSTANDTIDGGAGNDSIRGAAGDDSIIGGTGDDSIFGNEGGDTVIAGEGADSVYGEFGDDYIEGGAGDDHLEGNEGADTIYGGDGNDWIRGSYDNDEIWGGAGDDYLWGGYGDDTFHIENGFGTDTIDAEAVDEINGDTLDLSLVTDDLTIDLTGSNPEAGTFSDGISTANFDEIEHIVLGGGRDTIKLADFGGADRVLAFDMTDSGDGTTNDQLDVSGLTSDGGTTPVNASDVTVADDGSGNAVLSFPGGESITLVGVAPAELATVADLVSIGIPDPRDFIVEGTAGNDLIDEAYAGDPDGDMIDAGDNLAGTNDDYVLAGAGRDKVLAQAGNDTVYGEAGNDTVSGGDGDDYVDGGTENDLILGGDGSDTLVGGLGDDTLRGDNLWVDYANEASAAGVTATNLTIENTTQDAIDLYWIDTAGSLVFYETIQPGETSVQPTYVEHNWLLSDSQFYHMKVISGAPDQTIVYDGAQHDDLLIGGDGNDVLFGEFGNDTIQGGAGNDFAYAGVGDDVVQGEDGIDTISGDEGADTLDGGAQNDALAGGSGADSILGGTGDDAVWGDSIYLDVSNLHSGTSGGATTLSVTNAADAPIELWQIDSTGTLVYVDTIAAGATSVQSVLSDENFVLRDEDGYHLEVIEGAHNVSVTYGDEGLGDTIEGGDGADTLYGMYGDDSMSGGTGADSIAGQSGDDTISLQDNFGNDTITGGEAGETSGDTLDLSAATTGLSVNLTASDPEAGTVSDGISTATFSEIEKIVLGGGRDTVVLADGSGADRVMAFDMADSGDGTTNDQLDVSGLTSDGGTTPVTTTDVTVTDTNGDGTGDAILTFPGGESITLVGVLASQVDSVDELVSIGIPDGRDYIVEGTASGDLINGTYTGDPEGDMVDAADAADGSDDDVIYGYGGDDIIDAGAGANTVYGGDGNDQVYGGTGADLIDGGTGNDALYSGLGDDTILGGDGNDTIFASGGADSIDAGAGNDDIRFTGGDTILGGDGDDMFRADALWLDGAPVSITGGEGAETGGDTLFSGTYDGDLTVDLTAGGTGADPESGTMQLGATTVTFSEIETVMTNAGNDSIIGSAGNDNVITGTGADTVTGGAGNDSFDLGAGDGAVDTAVFGDGDGADTITGFEGPVDNGDGTFTGFDQLDVSALTSDGGTTRVNTGDVNVTDDGSGNALLSFPGGESILLMGVSPASLSDPLALEAIGIPGPSAPVDGTAGNDAMPVGYTDADGDIIDGADGLNDTIFGYGGDDTIDAGAGDDLVKGGSGVNYVDAGAGDDTIVSEGANETLIGGTGWDILDQRTSAGSTIDSFSGIEEIYAADYDTSWSWPTESILYHGGAAGDSVWAGDGSDTLYGGAGADSLSGGAGDDLISAGAGDDAAYGGDGSDTLFGEAGIDWLSGGTGNDTIDGGSEADYITGGTGDDLMLGGADADTFTISQDEGNDIIDGGETGNDFDRLDFNDPTTATGISLTYTGDEAGTFSYGAGSSNFANIEAIYAAVGDDTIDASASTGNVSVWAWDGDDVITGGSGDDFIAADLGNDTVDGGAGADWIIGDAGDDSLSGGAGDDTLQAGTGADTLTGGAGNDDLNLNSFDNSQDVIVLADGSGADTAEFFEAPRDNGDGTFTGIDQFDVSGLTDASGNPVDVNDVTVSDTNGDGTGDAILSFPNGESVTLAGVTVGQVSSDAQLEAMGIPAAAGDFIVEGTGGDDLINSAYTGDPEGDMIDSGDAADGSDDDSVMAGAGNDSIDAGAGDDTIFGEAGDDEIFLDGALDNDSIVGGETGEVLGDRINFSAIADDITISFTAPEAGTISDGVNTTTFSEIERFQMGTGNDSVIGSDGAESIIGNYGDDTILGGGGDDTIYSGFDNDSVSGGAGNDVLWTSSGADTVSGGTGNDQIDLGAGDGAADLAIMADGDGADVISGFEAPLDNGDGTFTGRDQLDVSAMADASGNPVSAEDVIVTDSNGDGTGNAILTFPSGDSIELVGVNASEVQSLDQLVAMGIPAPAGDFIVEGTAGADLIDAAYAGDPEGDMIDNNDHSDGSNSDSILAGDGNDTILAGDGDDTVNGGLGDDSIEGGIGADSINGEEGNDTILGGDGNDTIYGYEGNDSVDGGTGDDWINTRTSPGTGAPDQGYPGYFAGDADPANDLDTVFGGDGNDTILTGDDDDYIDGGAGADSIDAGFDDDTVLGGDGNDTILANEGSDLVDGGLGDDLIHGDGTDTLTGPLNIDDATDLAPDNGRDTLSGGDGNDTIYGMDDADLLHGDAGDDLLDGGLDADTIHGDAGNDTMLGAEGDDLFVFADGDGFDSVTGGEASETAGDTLDFGAVTGDMTVDFTGDEAGSAAYGADSVTFAEIERLLLGSGNDTVDASASGAATEVWAGAGADTLLGGLGNDTFFGQDGADILSGGGGDDSLDGDAGDDTISGGAGNDVLIGDAGADSLTGGTGADVIHAGDDGDTILLAEGDIAYGEGGDDLFLVTDYGEAGANNATIVGGETGETLGDTLDFQGLTHWSDITYTNTDPGVGGGLSGYATLADGSVVTFSEIENVIICFTAGTRIATAQGLRAVETLRPGDLVVTRDNGLQPVRWAGQRTVPARGRLAPIRFAAGSIGNERDLLVSPQHRVLLQGPRATIFFGQREVLASAKHLVNGSSVAQVPGGEVDYVHILFDRHEIVYAEGAASESFFPGDNGLDAVDAAAREELFTIFPELRSSTGGFAATARICLRAHESRLLLPG